MNSESVAWPYPRYSDQAVDHGEKASEELRAKLKAAKWPVESVDATDYSETKAGAIKVQLKDQTRLRYSIAGDTTRFEASISLGRNNRQDIVAIDKGQLQVFLDVIQGTYPRRAETLLKLKLDMNKGGEVLYAAIQAKRSNQNPELELVIRRPNGRTFAETYVMTPTAKNPFQLKARNEVAR